MPSRCSTRPEPALAKLRRSVPVIQWYSGVTYQTQESRNSSNTSGQDKATPWDWQRPGQ